VEIMADLVTFPELGALTSDGIPLQQLYTDIRDTVRMYNEDSVSFKSMFCEDTTMKQIKVLQRSMKFQRMGSDTQVPDMQHLAAPAFDLAEPIRYALATAVTQEELDRGITSKLVTARGAEAIAADRRLLQMAVLNEMLLSGGWWDAAETYAPPPYKMNSFATTHQHYIGRAASGIPKLEDFATAKHHILEHGYEGGFIAWINSTQAAYIEKVAEWAPAATYNVPPTPVIASLQEMGMTPAFRAVGVPVYAEDWIPENYMLMISADQEKPIFWRNPEGRASDGGLQMWSVTPTISYGAMEQMARYVSVKVVHRGAGVVTYLSSGTWADPTITY
jgi:hypothetical protein